MTTTAATDATSFDRGRRFGLEQAALIAESMAYFATARAIRSGGDADLLEFILRERRRTIQAPSTRMAGALFALIVERAKQERKFPDEQLVDGTGGELAQQLRDVVQQWCDAADKSDEGNSFALVLAEEVLEALAETEPERLRPEVVQIGALCVKWLEAIDKRSSR